MCLVTVLLALVLSPGACQDGNWHSDLEATTLLITCFFLGACDVTHTAATHMASSVAGPCKDYAAHFLKVGEPQEPGGAVNWRFPKIGGYLFGVPIIRIIVVWALY